MEGKAHVPDLEKCKVEIYDSDFFPASERLARYRESLSRNYLPIGVDCNPEREFKARNETIKLGAGVIGRNRCARRNTYRTRRHVENTPTRYVYATLLISGECALEQKKSGLTAKATELVIQDSNIPNAVRWAAAPIASSQPAAASGTPSSSMKNAPTKVSSAVHAP